MLILFYDNRCPICLRTKAVLERLCISSSYRAHFAAIVDFRSRIFYTEMDANWGKSL